ncbi:MAG: AI-2E family transporter [Gammaproteobacteria bacterium]
MSNEIQNPTGILASLAALVIVVGGMKIAAPLLVPLLLALFIAILIASPYAWLQRKGVPRALALLGVLMVFCGVVFLLGSLVGSSAAEFSERFPYYQRRLREMTTGLLGWLDYGGLDVSGSLLAEYFDPGKVMGLAAAVFSGMQNLLANSFLILITVVFILLEAPTIPDKWRAARRDADRSLGRFRDAARNVNRYMAIKTATSLLTGALIALALWVIGVDYPLLWGVSAFLLNFIPNIGSIIAAVPVVLLALVQLGPGAGAMTALAYLAVNAGIGGFAEPRMMGKGLGLSTLVVFISLILWGWVLGAVGMLLSVPLTLAMKIALDSNQDTRWMAIMLGPRIEK